MYNVLICDDDKDIVNALKIYLSGGDYNFFEAYNGDEAVCTVLKNDIHLVLMDIMMPVSDGISATVKIRETHNMPIILLTAKSEDSDKILGLNIGADDYISKPFSPASPGACFPTRRGSAPRPSPTPLPAPRSRRSRRCGACLKFSFPPWSSAPSPPSPFWSPSPRKIFWAAWRASETASVPPR